MMLVLAAEVTAKLTASSTPLARVLAMPVESEGPAALEVRSVIFSSAYSSTCWARQMS